MIAGVWLIQDALSPISAKKYPKSNEYDKNSTKISQRIVNIGISGGY